MTKIYYSYQDMQEGSTIYEAPSNAIDEATHTEAHREVCITLSDIPMIKDQKNWILEHYFGSMGWRKIFVEKELHLKENEFHETFLYLQPETQTFIECTAKLIAELSCEHEKCYWITPTSAVYIPASAQDETEAKEQLERDQEIEKED